MKNVFILFFALLMFSCEDVELEQKTENVSDDYGLIVDVAEDFANKMQMSNHTRGRNCNVSAGEVSEIQFPKLSSNSTTRVKDDTEKKFYTVSMTNNQGVVFVVRSGSVTLPLAYFLKESKNDINKALYDSSSDLSFLLNHYAEISLLASDLGFADESDDIYVMGPMGTCYPKCKVYWHQEYPYNRYCFTNDNKQASAGCLAIAGAQALTVLRPQMSMISSWDEVVKESPSELAVDEIARLVSYVGKEVEMSYGINLSVASSENLVSLFSKYGIKNYGKSGMFNVLLTNHGVGIISGNAVPGKIGHAFLADGFQWYHNGVAGAFDNTTIYLHLNYGWGPGKKTDAYVLSIADGWKKEAEKIYGRIFRYNMNFYAYAFKDEYENL